MSRVVIGILILFTCRPSQGAANTGITDSWDKFVEISKKFQSEGKLIEARKALLAVMNDAHKSPTRLAYTYNELGTLAQELGKYPEAERDYRLAIHQWDLVPGHPGIARTMNNLASVLYIVGKVEAADEFLHRAELVQVAALGANHPETARLYQNRATLYLSLHQYEKAELAYRQALQIWDGAAAGYDLQIAGAARGLAIILKHTSRSREAVLYDARARAIWERELSKGYASPELRAALARVYLEAHEPLLAEPVLKQAIFISDTELDPDYPFLGPILRMYADVCRQTGRKAEARRMDERAKEIESRCSQMCQAQQTITASDLLAEHQSHLR
jgi:tetratricopeptide (TPR) repeat protein